MLILYKQAAFLIGGLDGGSMHAADPAEARKRHNILSMAFNLDKELGDVRYPASTTAVSDCDRTLLAALVPNGRCQILDYSRL